MTASTEPLPVEAVAGEPHKGFPRRVRDAVLGDRDAGWWTIAGKELTDHLVSARFVVLLIILSIAAAATVYVASGAIREAAEAASETRSVFLALFTLSDDQIPPFFGLVGFLIPLVGIAFGFDAINGERASGTLSRLLAQPIYRDDVINGKFVGGLVVIGVTLLAMTAVVAGIGMVRLGITPDAESVLRLLLWVVVSIIYVGFWLAFATLCSVAFRRAATSALVAIGLWIAISVFANILVSLVAGAVAAAPSGATNDQLLAAARFEELLARLSPSTLYQEATVVLLNPGVRTIGAVLPTQVDRAIPSTVSLDQSLLLVWPQVVAIIGLTVTAFAAAYILFMRQEVRA
jgi:ABC-2 type transport system permease protein